MDRMSNDVCRMLKEDLRIDVPSDLGVFAVHFPGNPIFQGIYSLELAVRCVAKRAGRTVELIKVSRCKFQRPLLPGMSLEGKVRLLKREGDLQQAKVEFLEGDSRTIASMDLTVKIVNDTGPQS